MFRKLLLFLGLRKAAKQSFLRRNSAYVAPIGGVIPALAWLAYQNRAKLRSMYREYVEPKFTRGRSVRSSPSFQSAAI